MRQSNIYTDVIVKSMLSEIKKALNGNALVATITLIYVCIDSMTYLGLPINQKKQDKNDFIKWVDQYLNLKTDPNQQYQYNGIDVYAARCGQLHAYSTSSQFREKHGSKKFGYHNGTEHLFNPDIESNIVLISVTRLTQDFYRAVQLFIRKAQNDKNLKQCIDSRIEGMYQQFQTQPLPAHQ